MPPNANTHTRAKPHVCPRTPRPQHSYPVQHPGSSHGGLLHTPQLRRSTLPQPSSCMHRCHRTRSSTYDRVNDYHSQGANCKRRPHILDTHLDQISTPAPAPSVLPIHPRHTCTTAASMASRLCGYSIQAKHHTPCVPYLPLTAGATARLGFHRNISVAAAESCELRPHASRCRRRLEGGLRGRQVGRTGPMGALVATRPAARPAANVRGGRHHHQC